MTMEALELKDKCIDLFNFFDEEREDFIDPETGLVDLKLLNFVSHLLPGAEDALSTYLKNDDNKIGDKFIVDFFGEFWSEIAICSFAVGFAFGNLLDPTDPDILSDLDLIKGAIKEKQLLPYLPRERKGGGHEKGKHLT